MTRIAITCILVFMLGGVLYFSAPVVMFVAIVAWNTIADGPAPSDKDLTKQLSEHKAEFEELIQMFDQDKLAEEIGENRIGTYFKFDSSWCSPTDEPTGPVELELVLRKKGISKQRYQLYVDLLKRCKVKQVSRDRNGVVTFSVWSSGLMSNTSHKSIIFSPTDNNEFACSQISPNWYITYDEY